MQLDLILSKIEDIANVEQRPTMEARTMAVLVAPKPVVFQRLASERAQKERDRGKEKPDHSSPDHALDSSPHDGDDDDDDHDDDDHGDEGDDHDEAPQEADTPS
jgi:hypothetical protein